MVFITGAGETSFQSILARFCRPSLGSLSSRDALTLMPDGLVPSFPVRPPFLPLHITLELPIIIDWPPNPLFVSHFFIISDALRVLVFDH